nr:fibrinogen C domain-containing protein 1-like [Drosophila takahashii]
MEFFKAPCNSSGWMTIQRRQDGSEDFARNYTDYRHGFGNLRGEFFIGLEKLHQLTKDTAHELFIKLGKVDGSTSYAHYDNFQIDSEQETYKLKSVGGYSGNAGDPLSKQVGSKFSTVDMDFKDGCTIHNTGGWWHSSCAYASVLNGKYYENGTGIEYTGIRWTTWETEDTFTLTFTEMMIRPNPDLI